MELLSPDIEIILEASRPEKRVPLSPLVTAAWTSPWTLQRVGLEAEANSNPGGSNSLSKEEELSSRVPEAWAPGGRGRGEECADTKNQDGLYFLCASGSAGHFRPASPIHSYKPLPNPPPKLDATAYNLEAVETERS